MDNKLFIFLPRLKRHRELKIKYDRSNKKNSQTSKEGVRHSSNVCVMGVCVGGSGKIVLVISNAHFPFSITQHSVLIPLQE